MSVFQKYILFALVGLSILCFSCGGKNRAGVEAGNTKVAGVVLDADGKPVSAAIIRLYFQTEDSLVLVATDTTNAEGVYHLEPKQEGSMVLQIVVEQRIWKEQAISIQVGTLNLDVELPEEPEGAWDGDSGTITDSRDGQLYPWVRIGTQIWLAKNLNYSGSDGNGGRAYDLGWCYGDLQDSSMHADAETCEKYGRLYKWNVAVGLRDDCDTLDCGDRITVPHPGICPEGWRVPDSLDFAILDLFVVSDQEEIKGSPYSAQYLKSAQTDSNEVWNEVIFQSVDPYGFAAHPAGWGNTLTQPISYQSLGAVVMWWTAEDLSGSGQMGASRSFQMSSNTLTSTAGGKLNYALSLRCIQ